MRSPCSVASPPSRGVTLQVDSGEIVWLRGPNGAGKTTLLRLCAGLVPITRGRGTVLGCDLATERERLRPLVGLLGHRNGLYLDLTVSENVAFWGSMVGATPTERRLGARATRPRQPPRQRPGAPTVRRSTTAHRARLPRRPPRRAVAARRATRRARRTARDDLDAILRQAAASGASVLVASHESDRARPLASRVVDLAGGTVRSAAA